MDAEGNIISPLGCFKLATSSPTVSSPLSTTSTSSVTATCCTMMASTAVTRSSARTAGCVCCPLSGNISTCPALSQLAVPQPSAAARGATTRTTSCATMGSTAATTPAMTAALVTAPDFRSMGQIPAYGLTSCIVGGVRIPPNQKKVLKLISTLETALKDKDKTTTRLIMKHETALHDEQRKYQALYFEPTQEEITMYEFHLQKEVRGPPIYSPNLPRPTVNWNTLNKHKRKNLPDPEIFPIHFVPVDPNFYQDATKYKPAGEHKSHDRSGMLPVRISKEECGCARCVPPFGQKYGLMTDMGVIPMPDTSVHGYRWNDVTASWVIATGG